MTTSLCAHCIFNIKTEGVQVGCALDRLVKYDAELVDKNYVINGLCQYLRNCYSDVALSDDPIGAVKKECEVKYGVIYTYDGNAEALNTTLSSLSGEFEPIDAVVCYNDPSITLDIQSLYDYSFAIFPRVVVSLSQSIEGEDDEVIWFNMYEMALKRTKGDYIYFCDYGEKVDKNCISHLNSLINDDLKSIYLCIGQNFTVVYKKLFQKFAHLERPIQSLYSALTQNEKLKDTVISWQTNNTL